MVKLTAALVVLVSGAATLPLAADEVDFNTQIRPLLSNNCFRCHGPDPNERQADLRLDTTEGAVRDLGGYAAIVPGDADASELLRRISSDDEAEVMPPPGAGKRLSETEVAVVRQWIDQGARYAKHWSYVKPQRPALPEVSDPAWCRNAIDTFLLARLDRERLQPSPPADRLALARRVALDLTGLPPTPDQMDQFLADQEPGSYERLVNRLLDREAYGEHWARMWLDLARYADSAGYADDPARTIWAYRDYVIRSFNANKPFDQFTLEQIAGDLLPQPTEEQLIATAFHRNTLTNNEGGTNDEEYRNVAIVDRVNTTMAVWMGTTIACAQCHTHKYDPITQEEYFQLFAIFNNTEDADRRDESPLVHLFSAEQQQQRQQWQAELETLSKQPEANAEQIAALQKQLAELQPLTTVPVMRELQQNRRTTRLQYRGSFLDQGPEVSPGVPATFHPLASTDDAADDADRQPDRLALAHWLVDADNPLTARVIVNRYWERIFGVGLVRTSEEFGSQGELPEHPELLDWLAVELVESGWDLKHLLRLMVNSAAYRQSSRVTPDLYQRDPDNRWLARGPRFRISAEMIRDQVLAVSGLLSNKMYGPPVRPYQPQLGVSAAFGGGIDWTTSEGEDRYRRGIYTTWRRSNPYPSMAAFDAPNREVCTIRRDRTNTPLQALVTLNDPVYIEASQALARRMQAAARSTAERAAFGFRACLIRPPSDEELAKLVSLYDRALEQFRSQSELATAMATDPIGPAPPDTDVAELAAWTVVANVLLNLDEMFMKR